METLEVLKAGYVALLAKCKKENRGMTDDEIKQADRYHSEIERAEQIEREANRIVITGMAQRSVDANRSVAAAMSQREEQQRSLAAAVAGGQATQQEITSNEYYRSLAKGAVDVGNKEVIADVVRVYQQTSPIFAAHTNVQARGTGNAYTFTKVAPDLTKGYIKTEGDTGREDTTTSLEIVPVAFKLYDSEKVLITQELLDDAAVDLGVEISAAGLAKSGAAFGADLIAALMSAKPTPSETAGIVWTITDLANTYFSIPLRNRTGLKYIMNSTTAAKIIELLGVEAGPRLAVIGLTAEALLVDEGIADDTIILTNVTTALAIGQKTPVRVLVLEVSEGRTYEIQPRFAVALRDATAVAIIKLKAGA